jgi:dTDP-4-dehydrorhamnose 3,5-epimerase
LKLHGTPVEGAFVIAPDRQGDDRGFFARLFCEREFAAAGLASRFVQINNSLTARRGTLRGLHYQLPPAAEVKVVRCIRGAMFDVVADLRPDSSSYGQWFGTELTGADRAMMYVPQGCAHGFVTLTDEVETLYLVSAPYTPELERGLPFDDPWLGIRWPIEPLEMSAKDRAWPRFNPVVPEVQRLRGLRGSISGAAGEQSCAF